MVKLLIIKNIVIIESLVSQMMNIKKLLNALINDCINGTTLDSTVVALNPYIFVKIKSKFNSKKYKNEINNFFKIIDL